MLMCPPPRVDLGRLSNKRLLRPQLHVVSQRRRGPVPCPTDSIASARSDHQITEFVSNWIFQRDSIHFEPGSVNTN